MRAYFFCNFAIRTIQQGIQASHALAEMYEKYSPESIQGSMLGEWARDHKTTILLNGGFHGTLIEIIKQFQNLEIGEGMVYPYSIFFEDEYTLNGAATAVGIILPSSVYEKEIKEMTMDQMLGLAPMNLSPLEMQLRAFLTKFSLAT